MDNTGNCSLPHFPKFYEAPGLFYRQQGKIFHPSLVSIYSLENLPLLNCLDSTVNEGFQVALVQSTTKSSKHRWNVFTKFVQEKGKSCLTSTVVIVLEFLLHILHKRTGCLIL